MKIIDIIFNEHLYQFVLTLLVLVFYFFTNLQGKPTNVLENILFVVVTFWFASNSLSRSTDVNTKLDQLNNKVTVSEAEKVSTSEVDKVK